MRNIMVPVFTFDELSEEAKDRAKQRYAELFGYHWADEALDSIQALAKHFGGKVTDYSVDWFACSHSPMSFDMPKMSREEIQKLLEQLGGYDPKTLRGHGDCKLTGFCMDEDAIDGLRKAFMREGETNLGELMQAAFDSWFSAAQDDCASFYSNEQFSEHCAVNHYEFYEDGRMA